MNTPAHLIFATAAFAHPHQRGRTIAAICGALAPDLSLYLMSITAIFILGYSPQYVFDILYFSPAWQQVFAIDNSFILWGIAFGLSTYLGVKNAMVFTASALLHLAFDFPLHHDDARAHFWPVSDWVFESPFSYWDPSHFGDVIGGAGNGAVFNSLRRVVLPLSEHKVTFTDYGAGVDTGDATCLVGLCVYVGHIDDLAYLAL